MNTFTTILQRAAHCVVQTFELAKPLRGCGKMSCPRQTTAMPAARAMPQSPRSWPPWSSATKKHKREGAASRRGWRPPTQGGCHGIAKCMIFQHTPCHANVHDGHFYSCHTLDTSWIWHSMHLFAMIFLDWWHLNGEVWTGHAPSSDLMGFRINV